ncbi:hypothetical protein HB837_13750 [Listeria innocua]|uniref:hypothetical protein n=1 Tax=Listeria innocua TaxID=1642 RepID=UPI00162891F0|nr:hypothetical protein [Listeria innocua]MBC1353509.1 hypothetical protein [Listeria innocua]
MVNAKKRNVIYVILSTALLLSLIITPKTVSAQVSEQAEPEYQQKQDGFSDISTGIDNIFAEKYITFNSELKQYVVSPSISTELTYEQVEAIKLQVEKTNEQITLAKKDSTINITAVNQNGNEEVVKRTLLRGAGVNSIKFHWNYARVKISKSTLQNIGTGLTLGGIWIPHRIVAGVCASLGVGISKAKSGIWFDYNYFSNLVLTGYGWQ